MIVCKTWSPTQTAPTPSRVATNPADLHLVPDKSLRSKNLINSFLNEFLDHDYEEYSGKTGS